MYTYESILDLKEHPELEAQYAQWQHEKWGIPLDAYLDSLREARAYHKHTER